MQAIKIPELKDCMTDLIEKKLLSMGKEGLLFYELFKNLADWRNKYTIAIDCDFYWIKELKGNKFDTKEEAELYAFLDYCSTCGLALYVKWRKTFLGDKSTNE